KELASLCLVSRQLYILTTPYIYRSIHINFTRASSKRALHQLIRPGCRLPEKIHRLSLSGTDKDSTMQLLDLYVLFSRLTCLQELIWEGSFNVPHFILETLSNRFPKARLFIQATELKLGVALDAPQPLHTVLNHPVSGQLTRLDFEPSDIGQVYDGFKQDVIKMLKHNQGLRYFRFHEDFESPREYPELLSHFQSGTFPQPKELLLTTHMFTCRELSLWAAKGGWSELTFLKLHDPQQLCEFIGKAPKLRELLFFTTNRFDIDDIQAHIDSTSLKSPFGTLDRLCYKDTDNWNSAVQDRRVIPWCILESNPQMKELDIHRSRFDYFLPGPDLDTASGEDIRKIRKLCPNLQKFNLDISLEGRHATWPMDVVEELAHFPEAIEINIYMHLLNDRTALATIHRFTCRKIFRFIVQKRQSLGLPCQPPFIVGFKLVKLFENIHDHWNVNDYDFWLQKNNRLAMFRYRHREPRVDLDEMSIDDLQQRRKQGLLRKLGWDRKGYEREMHRRQQGSGEGSPSSSGTLYDLW
ncbi:hypothetical protein IQ07DRAFT_479634, partial [Pyrenochaeta sp. DS3sAY3a]